jgi:hypothetical protein
MKEKQQIRSYEPTTMRQQSSELEGANQKNLMKHENLPMKENLTITLAALSLTNEPSLRVRVST